MGSGPTSPIREPLVKGHKTYHQITEDLCSPTERAPSRAWTLAFIVALTCIDLWGHLYYHHHLGRYWYLEAKPNHRVGLGYYQLRLVDRYWSRWYADFGHPFTLPSEMEDRCKPGCRSDDHFCRYLCCLVSGYSRRKNLDCILLLSLSKYKRSIVA